MSKKLTLSFEVEESITTTQEFVLAVNNLSDLIERLHRKPLPTLGKHARLTEPVTKHSVPQEPPKDNTHSILLPPWSSIISNVLCAGLGNSNQTGVTSSASPMVDIMSALVEIIKDKKYTSIPTSTSSSTEEPSKGTVHSAVSDLLPVDRNYTIDPVCELRGINKVSKVSAPTPEIPTANESSRLLFEALRNVGWTPTHHR